MLKHRLFFGTLMTLLFTAVVVFDGWLDGSFSTATDNKPIQGTLFCILIVLLIVPGQFELSKLAAAKNLKIFLPVSIAATILFSTSRYIQQFIEIPPGLYFSLLSVFVLFALLLYHLIYLLLESSFHSLLRWQPALSSPLI